MSTALETTAADATTTTVVVDGGAVTTNGDSTNTKPKRHNNRKDNKNEQVNVEDVYDLSKPIPKTDKPDEKEFQNKLQDLSDLIDALKVSRTEIQDKIEKTMADAEAKSGIQAARTSLNELKNNKNRLIEEKKVLRTQLDQMKNQTDLLLNEKKNTKSNVKFNTIEEIDKEINALQKKQETTSMSLQDEKRLIKDIDNLRASKKFVAELKNADSSIDDVKEQKKNVMTLIQAKDKEIDEYSKQIKTIMETIDGLNNNDKAKKEIMGGMLKERDEIRNKMNTTIQEKDTLRDEYRSKNDEWYTYQRAIRKQKQMVFDEERKKREEENVAYKAKLEEEEAKKIPYEEEQALCEFLANYLERTYMNKKENANDDDANTKTDNVVQVKDDPFAGLKPVNNKNEAATIEYFGKGKGEKKKRVRTGKKQDEMIHKKFTISVDTFEQFDMIQLVPPTSLEQVEASIQSLREKKEWYKVQPRGSVPTATEIRKQQQQAKGITGSNNNYNNNKPTNNNSATGKGPHGNGKNNKGFELSNDDFVPLGGSSASTTTNNPLSSGGWGQQKWGSTANATASTGNMAPTPAEAAASAAAPTPAEASAAAVHEE